MFAKFASGFLLLAVATLFLDTYAITISTDQPGKMNFMSYGKCLFKCHKSHKDPVCAMLGNGKHVNFGRKTYDCLKKNCGRGGIIKHTGVCMASDLKREHSS
ncbi:uncharacterized protein LOC117177512 [Belonocnema kinseyi]|uniref:uncharacterized protein LOC117177512 n=1 Tax=Belonocnema kinseyi TaxID=2817044 RepID=UPI00143D6978|nr:uncharacterized protein LOC117177512 [Belonocnema kinseyi]